MELVQPDGIGRGGSVMLGKDSGFSRPGFMNRIITAGTICNLLQQFLY